MIEILNRIPISAKVITVGCDDLKDSVVNGEEGDIEGAAKRSNTRTFFFFLSITGTSLESLTLFRIPSQPSRFRVG